MKVDLYKVGKRLLKYYLIYHLVYDLYLLGQVAYWYFSESQVTWYHRMMDNPILLIDLIIGGPIATIIGIIFIMIHLLYIAFEETLMLFFMWV